jgi:hypothetical protein
MLKVFNSYLRSEELAKAENEVTSKGGKRAVVLSAVKPFRALPPFNAMYVMDGDKPKVENGEKVIDRPRQTKAILDMIKLNPVMIQSIKEGSAAATDSDADENDE